MRALVHEIRDRGGAREIHLRVACPPIIAPCYYGIDMSRRDELFATPYVDEAAGGVSAAAQERMARELGADSLRYLPVEAIARSVSLSPDRLCRACITGQYPTETGQYLYQIETKSAGTSTRGDSGRAYEPVKSGPRSSSRQPDVTATAWDRPIAALKFARKIGRPSRRYFRSKLVR